MPEKVDEKKVLAGLLACGANTRDECETCPYRRSSLSGRSDYEDCYSKLCADAVALIKQQARCIGILDNALDENVLTLGKLTDKVRCARGEATRGFLEHLKRNWSEISVFVCRDGEEKVKWYKYGPRLLDELAEEFLGRGDACEGGEPRRKSYFSAEEVRCMSLEEVAVNREIIIRSMRTWHGECEKGGVCGDE